ncbi:MAG: PTS system mannose/fructose/sorbose family transporter subunit IID [Syntrophales bacterium]|jgi:mannose/fructose/N-acetylgalactosamine-specific phosphotransferase system component IID|nr:PTS system mannose/fructose/sorbose family transporter subunit IID [Syntrophales bacterium]MCK9527728.1 PTS system mannose/fructose/sorbose family transporter subunit IID [Syntrophales bacterium]MDX9921617.1 PTS system mannose/fructose/sorbose family transporter subunit IID [Syntrophales bacterium]
MKQDTTDTQGCIGLLRMFARSLLISASWNYSRMQNLGFAFVLAPLAESRGSKRAEFLVTHLDSFSSHPVMSSLIVGSVLKHEEALRNADAVRLKQSLAAPYAGLGVPFFWGSLRPLASILGVAAALTGSLPAPATVLIAYNAVHGHVRITGFIRAYRDGAGAMDFLRRIDMPEWGKKIRWLSCVVLAFLGAGFLSGPLFRSPEYLPGPVGALMVLAAIMLFRGLVVLRIPVLAILYGFSLITILAAGLL